MNSKIILLELKSKDGQGWNVQGLKEGQYD